MSLPVTLPSSLYSFDVTAYRSGLFYLFPFPAFNIIFSFLIRGTSNDETEQGVKSSLDFTPKEKEKARSRGRRKDRRKGTSHPPCFGPFMVKSPLNPDEIKRRVFMFIGWKSSYRNLRREVPPSRHCHLFFFLLPFTILFQFTSLLFLTLNEKSRREFN